MKEIKIPSSSFDEIALIFLAHLCDGQSKIRNASINKEVKEVIDIFIKNFDSKIKVEDNLVTVEGIRKNLQDDDFLKKFPDDVFYFEKESSIAFSMFLAFSCLFKSNCVFSTRNKFRRNKDYKGYIDALTMLGCYAESTKGNNTLPLLNKGSIDGGNSRVNIDDNGRFLNALFLILPLCKNHSVVETDSLNEFTKIRFIRNFFEEQGIKFFFNEWHYFVINGFQNYKNFDKSIKANEKILSFFFSISNLKKRKFNYKKCRFRKHK